MPSAGTQSSRSRDTTSSRPSGVPMCSVASFIGSPCAAAVGSPELLVELAVDQNERDPARLAGAVCPAVIRAALDHDVAGAGDGLALVENQRDFPFEHYAVVDRLGTVHERVTGTASGMRGRVGGPDLGEMRAGLLRRDRAEARILRRDIEHANPRAVLRRCERDAVLVRLAARTVDARRRLARVPNLVKQRPELAADTRDPRRRPVLEDDRSSAGVVSRDDTAKGCSTHYLCAPE